MTLPKEARDSLGITKKVLVISAGDHIKIIPLPNDLLQKLHGAFNVKKPFKELRKQADRMAENEVKR